MLFCYSIIDNPLPAEAQETTPDIPALVDPERSTHIARLLPPYSSANVRQKPSLSSPIIGSVNGDTQVRVEGKIQGASFSLDGHQTDIWLIVPQPDGTFGYVWSGLMSVEGEVPAISRGQEIALTGERIFSCLGETNDITNAEIQRVDDEGRLRNFPLDSADLEPIWTLRGRSIWVGYANGGWDYPEGLEEWASDRYWIKGDKAGTPFWAIIYVTDHDYAYGYVFDNTVAFTDSNGEHYGQHPCGGWELDSATVEQVLQIQQD